MREVLKTIGFLLVVAALGVLIVWAMAAQGQDTAYQEWEKAASQAGAGEVVPPPPDPMLTAHESFCEHVKGWCPTVTNGVMGGKGWCQGKGKVQPKCYWSHLKRAHALYLVWREWIESDNGGFPGLFIAGTMRTESEGAVFGLSDSWTMECGLMGIDYFTARDRDINACDPRANIWASGYGRNAQLINARKRLPGLDLAPLEDQWLIAGAMGAIGSNKIDAIIAKAGALRVRDDGTLFYAHPYDRILKWLTYADKHFNLYSMEGMWMLGPNPGKGAFRIARPWAQRAILGPLYADGIPWGEPILPPRPDGLDTFPGKDRHCKCAKLWPEYKDDRPTNAPDESWPTVSEP
jgi:hypothetical protein